MKKTADRPMNRFLLQLKTMLGARAGDVLHPCIVDLVRHGLDAARFEQGQPRPHRQDITQYLAAWSRHAGLDEEACREWLTEYCVEMLSLLTKRSPAAIRHSTKSNIRYIYRSEVPFLCGRADNPFKAECRSDCPVYSDMPARVTAHRQAPTPRRPPPAQPLTWSSVKERHRKQFEEALDFIRDELAKGTKCRGLVELLHLRELKTRTGRPWTEGILRREMKRMQQGPRNP